MRKLVLVLALAFVACAPAPTPTADAPEAAPASAPEVASVPDPGPYRSSWDSAEFSRFDHTLVAPAGGPHLLTLTATTNSPGGETVAVYPVAPTGEPLTGRIMFVIASTQGTTATETFEFPETGVQPVVVVVENASGRRFAGQYELSIGAAGAP
jgi:hypothetical protein